MENVTETEQIQKRANYSMNNILCLFGHIVTNRICGDFTLFEWFPLKSYIMQRICLKTAIVSYACIDGVAS